MRKRTIVAAISVIALGVVFGGHLFQRKSDPVNEIFTKYRSKHEAVRRDIHAVSVELREILGQRERSEAPRIYIALLTEFSRLQGEIALIRSWESGVLPKEASVGLMADSLVVLEYLHMTTAFAQALNRAMKETQTGTREIASASALERAAAAFPEAHQTMTGGISVLQDPFVLSQSKGVEQLVPIAKALFEGSDEKALNQYRVRFFSNYADNLIEKNRDRIESFQRSLARK